MSSRSVKNYYNGKTILVTGATGFLGRLFVAKLMRMGNLKEILLISRQKKGKSNEERLENILSGFLFEEMEKFDKSFKSKLKLVNGDMEIEDLGISKKDLDNIKEKVEIVVHLAATVRFDEALKKSIAINVRGTKTLLDIASEMKKLEIFLHVSTAFSHCPLLEIEEKFYEPPMSYQDTLQLFKIPDYELDVLTAKLIEPWPNTYTFTKAVSEELVREYSKKLPIAVIRPSIGDFKFFS